MDHDAQMRREHERQEVVRMAVEQADRIIMDASDGTSEMTNSLATLLAAGLACWEGQKAKWRASLAETPVGRAIETVRTVLLLSGTEDDPDFVIRDCLWARVALKFAEKATIPFNSALMRWDMEHPAVTKAEEVA